MSIRVIAAMATAALLLQMGLPILAAPQQDPRWSQITKPDLQEAIRTAAPEDEVNQMLILRSKSSGLLSTTYDAYKAAWKSDPQNGWRMLWYGKAALLYSLAIGGPGMAPSPSELHHEDIIFTEARQMIQKAQLALPKSAIANYTYGYLLWQYENQMPRGLKLILSAEEMAPNDPQVHVDLAEIYCNPSGNAFDSKQGVAELQMAMSLDKTFAYPHWRLMGVYQVTHQKASALNELDSFLKLTPATPKMKQWGDEQRAVINQMSM